MNTAGVPATYRCRSTPTLYAVAYLGDGGWAVADAGGNDILRVDRRGHVSTIAVLPPQPTTLSAEQVAGVGAPACLAGATYNFEPVPTDVERGQNGRLWVSTLPGGPLLPEPRRPRIRLHRQSLEALGSSRGDRLPRRATDLALGDDGAVYVAELFAGKVTRLKHGRTSTAGGDRPSPVHRGEGRLLTWARSPTSRSAPPGPR